MLKRIAAFPEQCHSNDLIVQLQLLQWALYTTKRLWWLFHYVYTYTCIRLFGSRFRNWSKFKWSCRLLAKSLHRSRFSSDLTNRATHSRLDRRLFWRRLPVTDDYFDRYTFTFQLYGPVSARAAQLCPRRYSLVELQKIPYRKDFFIWRCYRSLMHFIDRSDGPFRCLAIVVDFVRF